MADIVERLRAFDNWGSIDRIVANICAEAADEIERLREYNSRLIVEACKYMPRGSD